MKLDSLYHNRLDQAATGRQHSPIAAMASRFGSGLALLCLAILPVFSPAIAKADQTWPAASTLTITAPANPGGGWDQTARFMQIAMEKAKVSSVPITVENRGGAGGTIGLSELVENDKGDGSKLMVCGFGMTGAVLMHNSRHSLLSATPIARLTSEFQVIAVPTNSPLKTLDDLIKALRANPKSISWAGGSAGSADHVFIGLFAEKVGVDPRKVNYVAFTGGGDASASVLGGQVSVGVAGYGEWQALAEAGKLRFLGVSSPTRIVSKDVPTFSELGVDVVFENWRGLLAAPGLKPADRQALLDAVDKARSSQAWQDILKQNNWQDSYLAGQSFSRFIAEDSTNTQRLLARMGLAQGGGAGMPVDAYFFPTLAGSIMLAALLLLLTPRVLRMLPRPQPAIAGTQIKLAASEEVSLQPDLKRFATALATLLAYVAGLKFFGFLITTPLFFFVFCRLMRSKAWLRDAVVSILTTGAVFYLFQSLLGVQLP